MHRVSLAEAGARYLALLASPKGPAAYTSFGFVGTSSQELALRPIP